MTIKVEHVQSSITESGDRIDTLVCEYPYIVHAQLLTHGVFSKNASSARAVPIKKSIEQLRSNPAEYMWTKNQAGMQGSLVDYPIELVRNNRILNMAMESMIGFSELLGLPEDEGGLGIHKQNSSRLLIPFQNIRVVITSTEWENWDWLRIDSAAQGEIAVLAQMMKDARDAAKPMLLKEGEYHVPFIHRERGACTGEIYYSMTDPNDPTDDYLNLEEAIMVSQSVCAQTSFRNADYSLDKAKKITDLLFNGKKVHASPTEHQATPIYPNSFEFASGDIIMDTWPKGITHVDRYRNYWSGNFKGFIQQRQLIKGHDRAITLKEGEQ